MVYKKLALTLAVLGLVGCGQAMDVDVKIDGGELVEEVEVEEEALVEELEMKEAVKLPVLQGWKKFEDEVSGLSFQYSGDYVTKIENGGQILVAPASFCSPDWPYCHLDTESSKEVFEIWVQHADADRTIADFYGGREDVKIVKKLEIAGYPAAQLAWNHTTNPMYTFFTGGRHFLMNFGEYMSEVMVDSILEHIEVSEAQVPFAVEVPEGWYQPELYTVGTYSVRKNVGEPPEGAMSWYVYGGVKIGKYLFSDVADGDFNALLNLFVMKLEEDAYGDPVYTVDNAEVAGRQALRIEWQNDMWSKGSSYDVAYFVFIDGEPWLIELYAINIDLEGYKMEAQQLIDSLKFL